MQGEKKKITIPLLRCQMILTVNVFIKNKVYKNESAHLIYAANIFLIAINQNNSQQFTISNYIHNNK